MTVCYPPTTYSIPPHRGITEEEMIRSKEIPEEKWNDLWTSGLELARHTDAWEHGEHEYVFGAGDVGTAKILLIGEAPGERERQGIPFVGPAGQTLSGVLYLAGIHRTRDVFLTNTVSLAPVGLGATIGKPLPSDILQERERILETYKRLKPNIVVLVGKYAVLEFLCDEMLRDLADKKKSLPERDISMSKVNGFYDGGIKPFFDCPVAINYHPSYILRLARAGDRSSTEVQQELQAYYDFFVKVKHYAQK